jgi:hypothetical protein
VHRTKFEQNISSDLSLFSTLIDNSLLQIITNTKIGKAKQQQKHTIKQLKRKTFSIRTMSNMFD